MYWIVVTFGAVRVLQKGMVRMVWTTRKVVAKVTRLLQEQVRVHSFSRPVIDHWLALYMRSDSLEQLVWKPGGRFGDQ